MPAFKSEIETHLCEAQELVFGKAETVCVFVFVMQCGVEHGWVVGGKHDGDAVAKERG